MRRIAALTILFALALTAAAGAATVRPRVVGGSASPAGAYPWQVGLADTDDWLICGGTLLSDRWVLTADHCDAVPGFHVLAGTNDLYGLAGSYVEVDAVYQHPNADGRREHATYVYDVNLLRLAEPIPDAKPLQVATAAEAASWAQGKLLTITGWGDTEDPTTPVNLLRVAQVPRMADADCAAAYPFNFDAESMMCAGYPAGGVDTCQGDSGGPIAAPVTASPDATNPAHWRLVGVTSWGVGCADPGYPGVYARVADAAIRDWIVTKMAAYTPDPEPVDDPDPVGDEPDERDDDTAALPAGPAPAPAPAPAPVSVPAPPAPLAPAAAPAGVQARPAITKVARRCTRRRVCVFTVTTTAARSVRGTIRSTARRACRRGGRRTTCAHKASRSVRGRARRGATFTVTTARLPRGRHTLSLVATGPGGAAKPYRLTFTLR